MSIATSIIQGLSEALDYEKGNKAKAINRQIEIAELPHIHGVRIKKIRASKRLSPIAFAKIMGVTVKTIEAWEADKSIPSGPAQRLLGMIEQDDEVLERSKILVIK
jgi:putative transcriptional regulator